MIDDVNDVMCVVDETSADVDTLSGHWWWIVLLVGVVVILTVALIIFIVCFVACTRRPERLRLSNGYSLIVFCALLPLSCHTLLSVGLQEM